MTRTSIRARTVRLWPFAIGLLFLVYAALIPDPHAFNSAAVDRATWALGGLLLIWAGIHPARWARLVAMSFGVGLFAVRITVLAAYPSDLPTARVLAGACVWSMFIVFIVALTLASEIIDTPTRLLEH